MTLERIEFPCSRCGRPLSAVPGTKHRACAACRKKNVVPASSEPVPAKERAPAVEGTRVVKVRRARE